MAEDYIAFDKSEKKRKYGGGGDRRGSKRQKWNRNPEQSGANAMPLGQRSSGGTNTPADTQDDAIPTSISRPQVNSRSERAPRDTAKWSEKRTKREADKLKWRNREKELVQAVVAAEKAGTYKEEPIYNKKKLRSDGNVALDESRTYYELHGGTIDKDEAHEYLKRINDSKAPFASHLPEDMDEADRVLKRAKKEKKALCPADEFVLKVARMNPSRKDKKKDSKVKNDGDRIIKDSVGSNQPTVTEVIESEPKEGENAGDGDASEKKERFICFVGQLPFTCTTADIEKHFSSVSPTAIRHVTHKEGGQSKGYAFLEFDSWDRMRTCLKLYHHSEFNDGKSNPRKINIELTSGGGGNSEVRKERIHSKNEKLDKERKKDYDNRKQEQKGRNAGKAKPGSSTSNGQTKDGEPERTMTKYEQRMAKFAEDHRHTKTQRKKMEKQKKKEQRKKELERGLIDKIKTQKAAEAAAAKANGNASGEKDMHEGMDEGRRARLAQ